MVKRPISPLATDPEVRSADTAIRCALDFGEPSDDFPGSLSGVLSASGVDDLVAFRFDRLGLVGERIMDTAAKFALPSEATGNEQ